jgi:hypothetical protein
MQDGSKIRLGWRQIKTFKYSRILPLPLIERSRDERNESSFVSTEFIQSPSTSLGINFTEGLDERVVFHLEKNP